MVCSPTEITPGVTVRTLVLVTPLRTAEIVTDVELPTRVVVTVKVAVVALAATVTLAGTCATVVLLLDRVTAAPPVGAGPVKVTVPVEDEPPPTLAGFRVTEESAEGFTVSVAVLFVLFKLPVMVTVAVLATGLVLTVNVAVVAPAATVTLAGTCAAAVLLLDNVTTAPPVGAALLRVTVPVDEDPPMTLVGFKVTEDKVTVVGGVTVSIAVLVVPL